MCRNVCSIVNKTEHSGSFNKPRLITELGQFGPAEKSENSGYIHEMVTRHGTVGDVPDNYFYGNERK